jgi:hypothetical protein
MIRQRSPTVAVVVAARVLVATVAMAAKRTCTRADHHGCMMAKGGKAKK